MRMLGVQRARAERLDRLKVAQLGHILIIDHLDLLDFVRGAEAVEEMQKGHAGLYGGKMRDQREIHDFLHGGGGKHGKTGLAAGHNVRMVAEDGERMRRKRTGGNMKHAREQLAGNLVHIGDHQQ